MYTYTGQGQAEEDDKKGGGGRTHTHKLCTGNNVTDPTKLPWKKKKQAAGPTEAVALKTAQSGTD